MTERIKKTPLKKALAAMDIAWQNSYNRLIEMDPNEAIRRATGAMYYNSSHPFRDKLHIEGIQEGLKFALTGNSDVVKWYIEQVVNSNNQVEPPQYQYPWPQSRFAARPAVFLVALTHGIGWRYGWAMFKAWFLPKRLRG